MMPFHGRLLTSALLAGAALSLAACEKNLGAGPQLNVVSGYIQMGATPDRPAVGYFKVEGGPRDVQLMAVIADLAQRVEMHESVREDGMVTMRPLVAAPVPAKGELEFKPGGKHLMIWNINPAAVRAGKLPMQFVFSNNNNERILFDLPIKEAAAMGASGGDAAGHQSMDHGVKKGDETSAPAAPKK